MRYLWLALVGLVALLALVGGPASPAHGATFTVTKTADTADGTCDGDCSLREAITAANAAGGADTITVPADTYTLSIAGTAEDANATGDLDITDDVTLNGAGADSTIIDGGGIDRVFHVDPANTGVTAEISGVTVQNGDAGSSPGGGMNIRSNGEATLTSVTVRNNNTTTDGGGISVGGTLTLTASTVSGNGSGSTVNGGGIYAFGVSSTTLTNVTISGNTAGTTGGGGIYNDGTATLTNVTISGNSALSEGGGIHNDGTATLTNTIVANSTSGGDCSGTITSNGYNLDSDGSCALGGTGDISNTDPLLGALADNGGPTETHALLTGSPAYQAGDNAACPATDQRGVIRPQFVHCDMGAVEQDEWGVGGLAGFPEIDEPASEAANSSAGSSFPYAALAVGLAAAVAVVGAGGLYVVRLRRG